MSLAADAPAPSAPASAAAAAVRPPNTVRGPVLLVLVMGVIAAAIGLFVAATEKHETPTPTVVTVVTDGSGRGPAPLLAHTP